MTDNQMPSSNLQKPQPALVKLPTWRPLGSLRDYFTEQMDQDQQTRFTNPDYRN